jgi:GxGYxYP putative glycoside hydrolase C-terminal domain
MSTIAEMRPELLARFAGIAGLKGIFANYGRTHVTTPENLVVEVQGVPVFRAVNRSPSHLTFTPSARRDAEYFMIGEIKRWTPRQRPAFVHVFLANWLTHLEMAENIAKGLGPEYIAVRPDQLVQLYHQSKTG